MPKPEQTPEPSIEEILASIRRIIADDAPAAAVDVAYSDAQAAERVSSHRSRPANPTAARSSEDEVLELTEDFMLAEEAPSLALQEPAEPQEFGESHRYEHHGEDLYRDPYDENFARRAGRSEQETPAPQDESREEAGGMFSAVMAEVRRFTDGAQQKESQQAAPTPAENWGQPDIEALTPPLSRAASRPVWSARHNDSGPGHAGAELPSPRSSAPDPATSRKPDLASTDNWSRGVQMPVPDAGPALPFPSEETFAPRSRAAGPSALQPSHRPDEEASPWMSPAGEHGSGDFIGGDSRHTQQEKAEELADKVISDFTSDRVGAPSVVADILKGDKPLMDAITSSLADALSRETDDTEEFEEAPHPEDFADDMFDAGESPSAVVAEQAAASKPQRLAVPGTMTPDGGFVAQHPVKAKETAPMTMSADQEMPELPREEPDDLLSAANVPSANRPTYRATGIPEPLMPNVPVSSSRAPSFPVAGLGSMRETASSPAERLQAASGPTSLEETIKEMLKPLLMQWLDENMPRIVNEALREEIAASGFLPRTREARR